MALLSDSQAEFTKDIIDQLSEKDLDNLLKVLGAGKIKILHVRDTNTVFVPAVEVPLFIQQCLSALPYMESTTTSP